MSSTKRRRRTGPTLPLSADILPCQWIATPAVATPERTLCAAILEQAALDARDPSDKLRAAAWLWLRQEDRLSSKPWETPHGFSFRFICQVLHLNPTRVIEKIRAKAAAILEGEEPRPKNQRIRPRLTGEGHPRGRRRG